MKEWISLNWADCVGAVGDERVAHELAGTQVRPWQGSIENAVEYFAKYVAKSGAARRHYQDQPPELWLRPGCGLARVWSYRKLERKIHEDQLSDQEALWAQRILRRWHRAQKETVRVRVRRGSSYRWTTKPVRRLRARGGWLATPKAEILAPLLKRAAEIASGSDG